MTEENHMGWKLVRGVRQDVVKLFKLFANSNSVRYEDFCKIWKEMKFYTIFRPNHIERLEFIEEIFQIVKEYLLSVYEFHTRIAALYTLYGLYYKQPMSPSVRIRFTKTEWAEVQSLVKTCKAEKHLDAVFIYLNLYVNGAFHFTAMPRTIGLESGYKKYAKKSYTLFPNSCDVELLYRPLLSENLVSSLIQLEELYCKKKVELLGKRNIDFIDTKFAVQLQSHLKKYAQGDQRLAKPVETEEVEPGPSCSKETLCTNQKEKERNAPEKNSSTKNKMKPHYLLAKKRAELYIKQLREEESSTSNQQAFSLELPDLE
ncbi:hypothetical protein RUM44_012136 [Polyplax serrata]|uniref:snRNA-activating protein complex subunit 1 n=1 Tax=Polyplax serrata TaxID=468196 RepID=A0ABR1BED6_POLSC